MKAGVLGMGMMLAAGMAAAGPAGTRDVSLCRGAYQVMLMTEMECHLYARQVRLLQAQGKTETLAELKRQHDKLLEERATACPCANQEQEQRVVVAGDC